MKNYFCLLFGVVCLMSTLNPLQAQWIQTNNMIADGYVTSIAFSGATIYAGSQSNVYRSTDHGSTWERVGKQFVSNYVSIIGLALTDSSLFAVTEGGALFRFSFGSTEWSVVSIGSPDVNVSTIAFFGTHLFAGTSKGVYRSSDNGISWTPVNSGLTDTHIGALIISGSNLYVGTLDGLFLDGAYRSFDNGTTWTRLDPGIGKMSTRGLTVNGHTLYLWSSEGVFRSTDNGTN
jgi:photosystem II stability/assembly factor-like uncharacterized protein